MKISLFSVFLNFVSLTTQLCSSHAVFYLFLTLIVHLLFSISSTETPRQKSSGFCGWFPVEVFPLQTPICCVETFCTVDTLWCSRSPTYSSRSVSTQSNALCACLYGNMNNIWMILSVSILIPCGPQYFTIQLHKDLRGNNRIQMINVLPLSTYLYILYKWI